MTILLTCSPTVIDVDDTDGPKVPVAVAAFPLVIVFNDLAYK